MNRELTDKSHWNTTWEYRLKRQKGFRPFVFKTFFLPRRMAAFFHSTIKPEASFLEIGCGGSYILPYIAKFLACRCFGIDYSQSGIESCRRLVESAHVKADLVCDDLFKTTRIPEKHFDVVWSAGFIEHFSDITSVIGTLKKFASPGGAIITLIPNLQSTIGSLHKLADRDLFMRHRILSPEQLDNYHRANNLVPLIPAFYYGTFSLTVVNWNKLRSKYGYSGRLAVNCMKILQEIICFPFQFFRTPPESRYFSPYIIGVYRK